MRLILQRVTQAEVVIDGTRTKNTGPGLLILLGIGPEDTERTADFMAEKAANLRIFDPTENDGKEQSLLDFGGEAMVISNFTLYASSRKGRRPSYTGAAHPTVAEPLYEYFVEALGKAGVRHIETGAFGADMQVTLTNDGPVTIILDSAEIMPR